MKRHMSGWKVFFIVMGVLCLVGAAGSMLMVKFAAVGTCVVAALTMFMTASVCSWMDDLLEAVSRPKERASAETAWMSTEEKAMRARSEGGAAELRSRKLRRRYRICIAQRETAIKKTESGVARWRRFLIL